MDYELAKKLKDAGFPLPHDPNDYDEHNEGCTDDVCAPTLSQLIEACQNSGGYCSIKKASRCIGFQLQWERDNIETWAAELTSKSDSLKAFGKIPEEAVANLWLELNK